jgi:hypothetical protein
MVESRRSSDADVVTSPGMLVLLVVVLIGIVGSGAIPSAELAPPSSLRSAFPRHPGIDPEPLTCLPRSS